MGKFDGILICTDLDGTLLKNDKTISDENIKAIEYFKSEGGFFTFVTGRMPFFVYDYCEAIKPNAPIGCVNGAALFDYYKKEYIWKTILPDNVRELIKCIDDNFSDVGIQINTFNRTYFSKDNESMENFRKASNAIKYECDYNDLKEPLAKIIFGSEFDDEIKKIDKILHNHKMASEFDFIRSERALYEILPKGTGKNNSIFKLCQFLNSDIKNTIAIGDYDNDVSMLKAANIGIAVSNACKKAIDASDYVTVSNEENAIKQVILDLESGKFGKL